MIKIATFIWKVRCDISSVHSNTVDFYDENLCFVFHTQLLPNQDFLKWLQFRQFFSNVHFFVQFSSFLFFFFFLLFFLIIFILLLFLFLLFLVLFLRRVWNKSCMSVGSRKVLSNFLILCNFNFKKQFWQWVLSTYLYQNLVWLQFCCNLWFHQLLNNPEQILH